MSACGRRPSNGCSFTKKLGARGTHLVVDEDELQQQLQHVAADLCDGATTMNTCETRLVVTDEARQCGKGDAGQEEH